jgi:hypothetical protein
MWLFTPEGFISVVADKSDPTGPRLLARARSLHHLEKVLGDYIDAPFKVQASDYAWRAWIRRKDLGSIMEQVVNSIDYTNFKNSIEENAYHDACLGVWQSMFRYQLEVEGVLGVFQK